MTITQRGAEEVTRQIAGVAERLRDLSPVMNVIAADTVTLVDDSFRGQRAPDGRAWAPLAESTLARRRGGTASILTDTGRLRQSVNARATQRGLMFGTNVVYGRPHQMGTRRMPQRAFLPVEIGAGSFRLMTSGPAGAHWDRARESIRRYVATGEVR